MFKPVYGQEAVNPMEYIFPSLRIAMSTGMDDAKALEVRVVQLIQLEEDCFIVGFHENVAKDRQKVGLTKGVAQSSY